MCAIQYSTIPFWKVKIWRPQYTYLHFSFTVFVTACEKVERRILQALLIPLSKLKILKTSVVIQDALC